MHHVNKCTELEIIQEKNLKQFLKCFYLISSAARLLLINKHQHTEITHIISLFSAGNKFIWWPLNCTLANASLILDRLKANTSTRFQTILWRRAVFIARNFKKKNQMEHSLMHIVFFFKIDEKNC